MLREKWVGGEEWICLPYKTNLVRTSVVPPSPGEIRYGRVQPKHTLAIKNRFTANEATRAFTASALAVKGWVK
jgi:hypothetical protein